MLKCRYASQTRCSHSDKEKLPSLPLRTYTGRLPYTQLRVESYDTITISDASPYQKNGKVFSFSLLPTCSAPSTAHQRTAHARSFQPQLSRASSSDFPLWYHPIRSEVAASKDQDRGQGHTAVAVHVSMQFVDHIVIIYSVVCMYVFLFARGKHANILPLPPRARPHYTKSVSLPDLHRRNVTAPKKETPQRRIIVSYMKIKQWVKELPHLLAWTPAA